MSPKTKKISPTRDSYSSPEGDLTVAFQAKNKNRKLKIKRACVLHGLALQHV